MSGYQRLAGVDRGSVMQVALIVFLLSAVVFGAATAAALPPDSPYVAQEGEPAARTLYLIRHGQYDTEDEADPDVGRALVPLGVAQARLVAARLRSIGVAFTSLHSSTMTRARETARVIGEDLPRLTLRQSRLLRECTPPTWRQDIMAGETAEELAAAQDQLEAAFAAYFVPARGAEAHDIIVCHGNVIRYFVCKALQVDTLAWLQMSITNCSLTVVRIKPDGSFKLQSFADAGHLPPNMQTKPGGPPRQLLVPAAE